MRTSLLPFIECWKTQRLNFYVAVSCGGPDDPPLISTFLFFWHKFISLPVSLFNSPALVVLPNSNLTRDMFPLTRPPPRSTRQDDGATIISSIAYDSKHRELNKDHAGIRAARTRIHNRLVGGLTERLQRAAIIAFPRWTGGDVDRSEPFVQRLVRRRWCGPWLVAVRSPTAWKDGGVVAFTIGIWWRYDEVELVSHKYL